MALNINGTTGISGVDGSVSAPAVTGTDSNTGITFPAADTIKFSTGGVERFAISNSGLSGDGSGLTGLTNGITMADQWRITANSTLGGSVATLDNNWERNDTTAYGSIGSAMSQSSGLFTFPTTGIYYIQFNFVCYTTSAQRYIGARMQTTTDGMSSAINAADSYSNTGITSSNGCFASAIATITFDVTNTSTHKIRFAGMSLTSSVTTIVSDTDRNQTCVTFIRLGDT